MKLLNKISVGKIVKSHWRTLVNDNTKKPDFDDIFTFIILPVLIASILIWKNIHLNDEAINIIITAFSILVGLLFNVIVLIFDIVNRNAANEEKNEFLRQILSNISFAILLSIFAIIFSFTTFANISLINCISNWVIYFLSANFLLTVLMILKRIFTLFTEEIEEAEENSKP